MSSEKSVNSPQDHELLSTIYGDLSDAVDSAKDEIRSLLADDLEIL